MVLHEILINSANMLLLLIAPAFNYCMVCIITAAGLSKEKGLHEGAHWGIQTFMVCQLGTIYGSQIFVQ